MWPRSDCLVATESCDMQQLQELHHAFFVFLFFLQKILPDGPLCSRKKQKKHKSEKKHKSKKSKSE